MSDTNGIGGKAFSSNLLGTVADPISEETTGKFYNLNLTTKRYRTTDSRVMTCSILWTKAAASSFFTVSLQVGDFCYICINISN